MGTRPDQEHDRSLIQRANAIDSILHQSLDSQRGEVAAVILGANRWWK